MSGIMNNNLDSINKAVIALNKKHCFGNAQIVINEVISLLGIKTKDKWVLFNDNQGKVRSNATFFMQAEGFSDKRAAYKIADNESKNIDIKAYWVQNTSKANVSWMVALTPNYEDAPYFEDLNIGIDFIIPEKADRIIIVLSKNYVIRTLELEESLKVTQQEILAKWLQPIDYSNKAQAHEVLWSSFDLEPVNKQFYKDISGFFTELRQYLSEDIKYLDEKHAAQFANRLIGRIIFCWFLNKKGVISPSHKYFDADAEEGTKYYKVKLETLFFKVLNTEVNKREKGVDRTTPFLNGGIFEPKEFDGFEDKKLKFPKDYFIRLYSFFKHYNFTTDESTSTFQQIAIDPEMLGRIFENLLAEQVEETGEQARKAKGAFYTPREIVDFMCKESLREYLKTRLKDDQNREKILGFLLDTKDHEFRDQARNYRADLKQYKYDIEKALDEVKIIDPACGSGAFPMGMLHLILASYERIEPSIDHYKKKMEIIKNSIFGVDIEPMAIEIARLRVWLSIVVDEHAKTGKIDPLPNLVFKFVCANSLIRPKTSNVQYGFGYDLSKVDFKHELEIENKVSEIFGEYFSASSYTVKRQLEEKCAEYAKEVKKQDSGMDLSKMFKSMFKTDAPLDYFDSKNMLMVDKFDICIGNPPYVQLQRNHGILANLYKNEGYKVFERSGDIYSLFYELGVRLTKEKTGILCYITSNKWMRAAYGESLREYFSKLNPLILIDLGPGVFESATVDTNIMLLQNNENRNALKAVNINKPLKDKSLLADYFSVNQAPFPAPGKEIWFVGSRSERNLKDKIEKLGKPLKEWDVKINFGIKTGLNEAFILDKKTRNRLIKEDPKSKDIIKPIIRGRDVQKYYCEFAGTYIIATFPSLEIDINNYPAVKKYLLSFGMKRLQQSGEVFSDGTSARKKTVNKWYETQDPIAYYKEYEKEKLIWKRIGSILRFGFDDKGYLGQDSTCIMTGDNLKYLCAFMNSKLGNRLLFDKAPKTGTGDVIVSVQALDPLLVPPINGANKKTVEKIEVIVEKIIKAKDKDSNASIISMESEIDTLVYNLYDLSAEEVKIIEDKSQ